MADPIMNVTDAAAQKIASAADADGNSDVALRVTAREEGTKFRYELKLVSKDSKNADDQVIELDAVSLFIDDESAPRLRGATLDYIDDLSGSGLKFDNPNKTALSSNPLAVRVQTVLDDEINPGLAGHGGHVSLTGIHESQVILQFGGGCQGCGMADVTLKNGVTATLRERIPEITEVVDETDHQAGENPYYS